MGTLRRDGRGWANRDRFCAKSGYRSSHDQAECSVDIYHPRSQPNQIVTFQKRPFNVPSIAWVDGGSVTCTNIGFG